MYEFKYNVTIVTLLDISLTSKKYSMIMIRVKFIILKVCFVSTALKGGKFFAPCSCNVEACGCVGERIKITKPDKVNFDSYQNDKTRLSKLPKGKI